VVVDIVLPTRFRVTHQVQQVHRRSPHLAATDLPWVNLSGRGPGATSVVKNAEVENGRRVGPIAVDLGGGGRDDMTGSHPKDTIDI
jgi:hypothetical protein